MYHKDTTFQSTDDYMNSFDENIKAINLNVASIKLSKLLFFFRQNTWQFHRVLQNRQKFSFRPLLFKRPFLYYERTAELLKIVSQSYWWVQQGE